MLPGPAFLTRSVTFTMPSKWTMATLPKPHDSDVQLREEPGRTLAAITWSGASPSEAKARGCRRADTQPLRLTTSDHSREAH